MVRFSPRLEVLAAVLVLAVIGSALASAFDQVQIGSFTDNGPRDREIVNRTGRWSGNGPLIIDSVLMGQGTIVGVQGVLGTSYLRTNAYAYYDDGEWTAEQDYRPYQGQLLNGRGLDGADISAIVTPAAELHGQLVTVQRTAQLLPDGGVSIEHSPELDAFRTPGYIDRPYTIIFNGNAPGSDELRSLDVVPDGTYLQVPEALRSEVGDLARFIVQGIDDPFDQASALVAFLKEHYSYTMFYSETPAGVDQVEWFLFNSKMGMCTHFNSAFVLMARSLGLPARMCSGYLVEDNVASQNVTAEDAHAYAEIRFGEGTWVIFDATPEISVSQTWVDPEEGDRGPTLYGRLFDDRNRNQVQEFTDHPLSGWTVMLMNAQGTPVSVTTTSPAGLYTFPAADGDYIVKPFAREGYLATTLPTQNVRVGPGLASVDFGYNYSGLSAGSTPTTTEITSGGQDIIKGKAFNVLGTVTSGSGTVEGSRVQIFLAPSKTSPDRTLCGESEVRSGAFNAPYMALDDLLVGEYQLIARYLGDGTYSPSESDPAVALWDETTIQVSGVEKLIAELGGSLTFTVRESASGEVVPNANLTVSLDQEATLTTGADGTATLGIAAGAPRTALLNVAYAGGPYRMNSTYFSPIQIPGLEVDILSAELVRGESSAIIGRVHAGAVVPSPSLGASLYLLDREWSLNIVIGSPTIDRNGLFIVNADISDQVPLGQYNFSVSAGPLQDLSTVALNVSARTDLQASVSGNSVSVRLLDDRGEPLPGRTIALKTPYSTKTVTTDAEGRAGAVMDADGDCNCTVSFAAEPSYLASSAEVPVKGNGLSLIWLALVPAAVIPVLYLVTRKRQPGTLERPVVDAGPAGPYVVRSPQLADGLPLVWEAGAPLGITVEGGEGPLTLSIDGQPWTIRIGDIVNLTLEKGDHQLRIAGPGGNNAYVLRVVDYRSEIAKLYIDQVTEWCAKYQHIKLPMAPREVQALMGRSERSAAEMEEMVSLFEVAQYSEKAIGREEYERMFRAVKGVAG